MFADVCCDPFAVVYPPSKSAIEFSSSASYRVPTGDLPGTYRVHGGTVTYETSKMRNLENPIENPMVSRKHPESDELM